MKSQKTVHSRWPSNLVPFNPDEQANWRSERLSSTQKRSSPIEVLAFPVRQCRVDVQKTLMSSASSLVFSFQLISWMAKSSCVKVCNGIRREKISWVRSGNMKLSGRFPTRMLSISGNLALLSAWKDYVLEIVGKGFYNNYAINCYCVTSKVRFEWRELQWNLVDPLIE